MKVRILRISGRDGQAQLRQLQRVRAWMEAGGWQLLDYSEATGSAAFERAPGAPSLGVFDATRWLPGPDWRHPRTWMAPRRIYRRELALVCAVCLVVGAVFFAVLTYTASGPSSLTRRGASGNGELWLYVNANTLNVRESPVSEAQIVGVLYRNQKVLVDRTNEGWSRVVQPERGFVAAKFLNSHPVQ